MNRLEDFKNYLRLARVLELEKIGDTTGCLSGDFLMDNVRVYDVTDRRYAGINDMLQDLWFADHPVDNKKCYVRRDEERCKSYRDLHKVWSDREWLYIFLFHRITGSAASYVEDHGYRNTLLPELALCKTVGDMCRVIQDHPKAFFTSIGCQIPGFPKLPPECPYKKQSELYLIHHLPQLVDRLLYWLGNGKKTHREVIHFCNKYNQDCGFNRFWFQYSLFACDLSDYYPQWVDEDSHVHYGTNSVKALKLMGKKRDWDKIVEGIIIDLPELDLKPKGIENALCDYYKYIQSWIPKGYPLDPEIEEQIKKEASILIDGRLTML